METNTNIAELFQEIEQLRVSYRSVEEKAAKANETAHLLQRQKSEVDGQVAVLKADIETKIRRKTELELVTPFMLSRARDASSWLPEQQHTSSDEMEQTRAARLNEAQELSLLAKRLVNWELEEQDERQKHELLQADIASVNLLVKQKQRERQEALAKATQELEEVKRKNAALKEQLDKTQEEVNDLYATLAATEVEEMMRRKAIAAAYPARRGHLARRPAAGITVVGVPHYAFKRIQPSITRGCGRPLRGRTTQTSRPFAAQSELQDESEDELDEAVVTDAAAATDAGSTRGWGGAGRPAMDGGNAWGFTPEGANSSCDMASR